MKRKITSASEGELSAVRTVGIDPNSEMILAKIDGGSMKFLILILAIAGRDASILPDPDSKTYYLYASTDHGVVAQQSKDLVKWEAVPDFQGVDAAEPKVFAYRGRYYLFATVFNKDQVVAKPPESWRINTAQGTRILVSPSPRGPFTPLMNTAAEAVISAGRCSSKGLTPG